MMGLVSGSFRSDGGSFDYTLGQKSQKQGQNALTKIIQFFNQRENSGFHTVSRPTDQSILSGRYFQMPDLDQSPIIISQQKKMIRNPEKYSKLQWQIQQQQYLKELKEEKSITSWKTIAGLVNAKFSDRNRNGKQCRERYMNYVRFGDQIPKLQGWESQDDAVLFQNFQELGAKWVQISHRMQGRSQNCLKNRFYGALRRVIRKINKIQKQKKLKYKKSIKYDSLMRVLSFKTESQTQTKDYLETQRMTFVSQLRKDIISIATSHEDDAVAEDIVSLVSRIHRFNCMGRVMPPKRPKSLYDNSNDSIDSQQPKSEPQSHILQKNLSSQLTKSSQALSQNSFPHPIEIEESFVMQMINQNNFNLFSCRDGQRDLEQEICEIMNERYAPEQEFYF